MLLYQRARAETDGRRAAQRGAEVLVAELREVRLLRLVLLGDARHRCLLRRRQLHTLSRELRVKIPRVRVRLDLRLELWRNLRQSHSNQSQSLYTAMCLHVT